MMLWLMRHGVAEDEAIDRKRPLSAEGRRQAEEVARVLAALPGRPERILHSWKLRAEQTASIVADALGVRSERALGLNPTDVVEPWLPRAAVEELMIVGHLPFLGRLASELLRAEQTAPPVRFAPAGVVALERDRIWQVMWVLTPRIAEAARDGASSRRS